MISNGVGVEDEGADSEDDEHLIRATSHVWREPLQNYAMALHASRQRLEQDVEAEAASRKFALAARVHNMAEQRLKSMRERRETRELEISQAAQLQQEHSHASYQAYSMEQGTSIGAGVLEDERRGSKDADKEERLRRQREAARKKREDERRKKERDEEARRARTERDRQARLAEAERKAALTPEQREAEDRVLAEKLAREREEAAARLREYEESGEGRGARKRRRRETESQDREGSTPIYREDSFDHLSPTSENGAMSASRRVEKVPDNAYMNKDGEWYDAQDRRLPFPLFYAQASSDDGSAFGDDYDEKVPKKDPTELERRIWTQIARRDIPKVRIPTRATSD